MQLGIFAKTFDGNDPQTVLAAAAAAGYSTVQYNMACSGLASMPDAVPDAVLSVVQAAMQANSIEIAALSGTYNMIHPDLRVRAKGHVRLEVLAAAAASLSIPLITLCTGTRDPDDQWRAHPDNNSLNAWRDLVTSMETAVQIAGRYNVDLGIEPELANVVNSADKARRLINEIGSPRLKIVLDPANLFEVEPLAQQHRIVASAVDLLCDRIVMGHAKDRTSAGGFATAGKGVLDYVHYFLCLKNIGFDGPLITHGLAAHEAAGVAKFLRSKLDEAGIEVAA